MPTFSSFATSARCALAAFALLLGTGAQAQKAALVQNVDDDARVPYQQGAYISCVFAGNCALRFPVIPAGRRVVVENVSCNVFITSGSIAGPIILGSQDFRLARVFVPAVYTGGSYTANASTLMFYEAGEQPRIDGYSNGGPISEFFCTISGRQITLP